MRVSGEKYSTIWHDIEDAGTVHVIDQRSLPHEFRTASLRTSADAVAAISEMWVRGAPLIGATAAWGIYLAASRAEEGSEMTAVLEAAEKLIQSRPTAINLKWAVEKMLHGLSTSGENIVDTARSLASSICEDEKETCAQIGLHGIELIKKISKKKNGEVVNILTHCNAGWLACIDWGTATAPIYMAHELDIPLHIWVDETRPRNQGANLTAWELSQENVDHTVIVDNAGGQLMREGKVDLVIVGTDRTTRTGDVANKIGTYLKALAAKDNKIPFYVALPSSSIDWNLESGDDIPIEERSEDEVHYVNGSTGTGATRVRITPENSRAANPAFDITPSRLVTGLITERGICKASEKGLSKLFPEHYGN